MFSGHFPNITPAQVVAVFGWAIAQAVAYGWLTSTQSQIVLSAGATIIAAAWKIADSFLRSSRVKALAQNPSAFTDLK